MASRNHQDLNLQISNRVPKNNSISDRNPINFMQYKPLQSQTPTRTTQAKKIHSSASGAMTVSSFESAIPSCKSEPKFSTGLSRTHRVVSCCIQIYWPTITCCNFACVEHSPNLAVHWSTLVQQIKQHSLSVIKCKKLSPPPKQDLFHRKSS